MEDEKPRTTQAEPPSGEATFSPRGCHMNSAMCATLIEAIGKKFVVKEPVRAVKMTGPFNLMGLNFDSGGLVIELPGDDGGVHYVGIRADAFEGIYRPARKPRKA